VTPSPSPIEVYVFASPNHVSPGQNANFIIGTVHGSVGSPLTVFYSMAGSATLGTDYTLSGTPGQATIPAGSSSATVVLHAMGGVGKNATMVLVNGPGYFISSLAGQDTIRIR
jgi:hypothetical protein